MNKSMSTFIIIALLAAIAWLVFAKKPYWHSDEDLGAWFSSQLAAIADRLQDDIALDQKGEYPHEGRQTFEKRGRIVYILRNKLRARFDISDKNAISVRDIMETEGYRKLDAKVRELNLSIRLQEHQVEGDGVESFDELDEYTDDIPRYYSVTIGGW